MIVNGERKGFQSNHVSSSRRSWTLTLYWMDIALLRRQLSRVLGSTLTLSWHLRRTRNEWPRDVSTNFASCGRSGTRCQLTMLECWSTHLSLLKSTTATASYIKSPPSTYDHSSLYWTPQHDWLSWSRSTTTSLRLFVMTYTGCRSSDE